MVTPARPADSATSGTALSTSGRALTAVALLAGFYLLAAAIVLGLTGLDLALLFSGTGVNPAIAKLIGLSLLVIYPVLRVVFLTRRPRGEEPSGLLLTREQQPELWARIDRIAEQTGVRGPADLRLVPDVNAGVWEDTRLLGLIPGKRHLVVGAPLLLGLTEAELDSVLAHEFGHYSNRDVRLAGVTMAGRRAILHTVRTLQEQADPDRKQHTGGIRKAQARSADLAQGVQGNLAGVFAAYGRMFFRVSEAVSRRQEYAADRTAAQLAGRDATAAALRRLPVLSAAQDFYLDCYATIGWDAGVLPLPGQLYGGLAHVLADPVRGPELARLGRELPQEQSDPYDSHPPIAQRVAAVEALPEDGRSAEQDGPALALLREAERTLAALEQATLVPEAAAKRHADWPELLRESCLAGLRRRTGPVREALTDAGLPATLEGLLDALDTGRGWEIAGRLPKSEEAAAATGRAAREFLRPALHSALSRLTVLAMAEAELAHWEFSWSRSATLHLPEGVEEGMEGAVDAAVTDAPDTAPLRALAGLTAPAR
ncbi:M48 family metallopeptidase [Kitasatospora kazusensis]|uniref:M48 family metallopeptidase n=1 Tax=Kitasatospora kazusensis TaxID=407974 RepID=A0ABN2YUD1_9ACTN